MMIIIDDYISQKMMIIIDDYISQKIDFLKK